MAIQQFTATVRSDGSLVLPRETKDTLRLKPGEVVLLSLDRNEASRDSQETPEPFDLAAFLAETDAVERQPSMPNNPQQAKITEETAAKQRRTELKSSC